MKPRAISLDGTLVQPALVGVMVLLDRSGSMSAIKAPMEQAFKDFVETQQAINPDGMWLTLHQFDGQGYETTYSRTPLAHLGALGLEPRGSTPLRDSLYRFATEARKIIDDPDDETERLLLLIITDGEENASRTYTWPQVRELMDGLESTDCETLWFGTNAALIEAQTVLDTFQQDGASVVYDSSPVGAMYVGENATLATASFRAGTSARAASAMYQHSMTAEQAYAGPKLDVATINARLATLRAGTKTA